MRVTIFDYGAGNLHSLAKALRGPGVDVAIESEPAAALATDVLVLPGVGAFASAAARLRQGRAAMRDAIAAGLPTVGICLGLQLLFESSEEGPGQGLGVFRGDVRALRAKRSPQIGWNTIEHVVAASTAPLDMAYYANGFVCRPADESLVTAWSTHEDDRFPAIVRGGNVVGAQFHPEKSSAAGVRWIHSMLDEVRR
jgi:glutamine amidotransferase